MLIAYTRPDWQFPRVDAPSGSLARGCFPLEGPDYPRRSALPSSYSGTPAFSGRPSSTDRNRGPPHPNMLDWMPFIAAKD